MAGVNAELRPLRMTYPPEAADIGAADAPLGQVLFRSWVLLFGVLPIDRHALALTAVNPGEGFQEDSTTWLQRYWRHERRLTPIPGGCRVTDRLEFEPRVATFAPVVKRVAGWVFARRHRYLRARFGTADGTRNPP